MIKLIATDMDHTLLDNDSLLPPTIEKILDLCEEKDVLFVAASGRTLHSIETKFGNLKNRITILSDNGSLLKHQGKILIESYLEKKSALQIIKLGLSLPETSIIVTALDASYIYSNYPDHKRFLTEYYQNSVYVDDLLLYADKAIKVTFLSLDKTRSNFETYVDGAFDSNVISMMSGTVWIDVIRSDVSKGVTLTKLMNNLSISPEDAVAFGDYDNDIQMLESVGHSFAVENASDSVKAIASEVIGTNQSQAVANKIFELLNG